MAVQNQKTTLLFPINVQKGHTESAPMEEKTRNTKKARKVQIFAGGFHCGMSEKQSLETSLGGGRNVATTLQVRQSDAGAQVRLP